MPVADFGRRYGGDTGKRVLITEHTFLVETLKRILDGEIALPIRKDI